MRKPVLQSQIPALASLDRAARKTLIRQCEERDEILRRYRTPSGWVFYLFFAVVFSVSREWVQFFSPQALWWMGGKVCAQILSAFLLIGIEASLLRLFFINPRLQKLLRD